MLTFAIGDVHGCYEELQALFEACGRLRAGREAQYVLIGDYVDRGPDTSKVIDLLMRKQAGGDRVVCLRGNHEQMLLAAAAEGRSDHELITWWANGGERTLDSYGLEDPVLLPAAHLGWIRTLPFRFEDSNRLFVHAGIRPGIAIADQSEHDMVWIREPFLSSEEMFDAFVVHGHTPTKSRLPDLRPNRLNLDTGACFSGVLTAAAFTADRVMPFLFVNSFGVAWQP